MTINSLHPYIANYSDAYRSTLPLESLVLTEVLTEAHLYELGIDETDVHAIMKKRDETFRQLALSDRESLPAAAQLLHDSVANPTGLEDAVYRALLSLGFEAQKIGGNGKPDVENYNKNRGICHQSIIKNLYGITSNTFAMRKSCLLYTSPSPRD